MPVENIHTQGVLMFNKKGSGDLSDSAISSYGDIHDDDDFSEADLKWIKDKKGLASKHWRFLTDSQAKTKRKENQERENLQAELENRDAVDLGGLDMDVFDDSTGSDNKKSVLEEMEDGGNAPSDSAAAKK